MKLRKLTMALLAVAGLAFITSVANATTTSYNDGDLFLGFRATGGTGATTDYLLNIGQASQFTTHAQFTLSLGTIANDLSATFGSNWYSRTDLLYAVVGGTLSNDSLWASNPNSTPWQKQNDTEQS